MESAHWHRYDTVNRIPDNEFSEICTGDMESADTMYHGYLVRYDEMKCDNCGDTWWQKKDKPIVSRLCVKCRRDNLSSMNGGIL